MSNYDVDFQLDDDALPSMHDSVQFDDSETQDVGRLFVHEPTVQTENRNNAANEGNKKKGRGKTVIKWGQRGVRERVKWGKQGVPVSPREKCAQYSLFIGSLAADPGLYPIDVKDWRHFDKDDNHQRAWTRIEFPRLGGILPSNLLPSMNSFVNEVKLPKEDGIGPENLLRFKSSPSNF